jgi:hypothetical protein
MLPAGAWVIRIIRSKWDVATYLLPLLLPSLVIKVIEVPVSLWSVGLDSNADAVTPK